MGDTVYTVHSPGAASRYKLSSFHSLNTCFLPSTLSPPPYPLRTKGRLSEQFFFLMSSTGQASSSTYNLKFADALADYARITGIELSTNPFAVELEQSDSLESILQLLQEREEAFKKFRNKRRRLIDFVTPCVEVLHAISETLGEVLSLSAVSCACHLANFFNVIPVRSTSHRQRLCSLGSMFSSSYVPLIRSSTGSIVINEYARLPVRFHQATMHS